MLSPMRSVHVTSSSRKLRSVRHSDYIGLVRIQPGYEAIVLCSCVSVWPGEPNYQMPVPAGLAVGIARRVTGCRLLEGRRGQPLH